jgi:cytosine/adenosine deaminase-related metal-dependent hydrolase
LDGSADGKGPYTAQVANVATSQAEAISLVVSGTDGFGIEIIRELEVYHEAGLTNTEALAAATITPARLLNVDKKTGSIEVGKAADLVLVEGDPSERLSDLRQTRVVMLDGKLMDATRCAVPQDSPAGRSRLSDW